MVLVFLAWVWCSLVAAAWIWSGAPFLPMKGRSEGWYSCSFMVPTILSHRLWERERERDCEVRWDDWLEIGLWFAWPRSCIVPSLTAVWIEGSSASPSSRIYTVGVYLHPSESDCPHRLLHSSLPCLLFFTCLFLCCIFRCLLCPVLHMCCPWGVKFLLGIKVDQQVYQQTILCFFFH